MRLTGDLKGVLDNMETSNLIITPRYEEWLLSHADDPLPPKVIAAILEQLSKQSYTSKGRFSGSGAGTCKRRQIFTFLGARRVTTIPNKTKRIFIDGTWRHLKWQSQLLAANTITEIEYVVKNNKTHVVGTLDGRGVVPQNHPNPEWRGLTFGLELKSENDYAYTSSREETWWKRYSNQFVRYFIAGKVDLYVLIAEDKNTQDYKEVVLTKEDVAQEWAEEQDEVAILNVFLKQKRLPPILSTCAAQEGTLFERCPYGTVNGPCIKATRWPERKTIRTNGSRKKATIKKR